MLNIVGKRSLFFIITGAVVLISAIALFFPGLKPGIDFESGSMLTISFENTVTENEMRQELADLGYGNAIVQTTGEGDFIIRSVRLGSAEKTQLKQDLTARFGTLEEKGFESVEPTIAHHTAWTAFWGVLAAAAGILLYVTWAFRRMPSPFRYGTCAIIALAHDVLAVTGIFAILGGIFDWEINLMFITGVLAVLGYSVNNTVVIFDRIRENLIGGISQNFEAVVNNSLVETLSRSLNTSLTTLIVVLALLLFIGSTILNFAVVLLIGIIVGTFSSLFVAPLILVIWERRSQLAHPGRA
jgi:preprotein translocase subunit SecF